jgi:glycosyltransferase involved in cell wall biosynthesis
LRTVLIFEQSLLSTSQTFVAAQASALVSYRPRFAALQPAAPTLPLPAAATYLSPRRSVASRARKAIYDVSGVAPAFHRRLGAADPALIHAHFGPDGAAALPIARALQVPLVVTLHGYDILAPDRALARSLGGRLYLSRRRRLWERAAAFICVSNFVHAAALARGFPPEKLVVHYIGVDRAKFSPSPEPRAPVVLFVGRLIEVKGCEFALRAMARLQAAIPDARLVVIGNGPLRAPLEAMARDLGVSCDFLGAQSNDVVRAWMRCARVLCLPSITSRDGTNEAFGIVQLEAQASGTPVVAFRSGGIPEGIDDGVTGALVAEGDVAGLSDAMLRYLRDDELWRAANRHAPQWVAQRFDLHRQTAGLERIYDRAVTAGHGTAAA